MNLYFTEEYVNQVLGQYQNSKSPVKRSVTPRMTPTTTSYADNRQHITPEFFATEELRRRQLNESTFKGFDQRMGSGGMPLTNSQSRAATPMINPSTVAAVNESIVCQLSEPLITSDSFATHSSFPTNGSGMASHTSRRGAMRSPRRTYKPTLINHTSPPKARSTGIPYSGNSMPYTAKVIDYQSNSGQGWQSVNRVRPLATVDQFPEVSPFGELNARPMRSLMTRHEILVQQNRTKRALQGVNALQAAIAAVSKRAPVAAKPTFQQLRPILKNTTKSGGQAPPIGDRFARMRANQLVSAAKHTLTTKQTSMSSRRTLMGRQSTLSGQRSGVSRQQSTVGPLFKPNSGPSGLVVSKGSRVMRDSLAPGYESDGIIKTVDMEDQNIGFYCYHCDTYIDELQVLGKHCTLYAHRNNMSRNAANPLQNPLNKKLISDQFIADDKLASIGLTADTVLRMELDRIPIECKHYYYIKGIRLQNPGGAHPYHCNFCDKSIDSLSVIDSHLSSDSHQKQEKRPTFAKFMAQSTEPIAGLKFVTEYTCADSGQPTYECQLCQKFHDSYDMYLHVCSFGHRIRVLKAFNPNETILDKISETPRVVKEIERRVADVQRRVGT
ncbi:unnamed protein product, partial [Oppiella nova]